MDLILPVTLIVHKGKSKILKILQRISKGKLRKNFGALRAPKNFLKEIQIFGFLNLENWRTWSWTECKCFLEAWALGIFWYICLHKKKYPPPLRYHWMYQEIWNFGDKSQVLILVSQGNPTNEIAMNRKMNSSFIHPTIRRANIQQNEKEIRKNAIKPLSIFFKYSIWFFTLP